MKYRISKEYIKKRKRGPIFCAMWGLIVGSIFLFSEGIPLHVGVIMMLSITALCSASNWWGARKEIEFFSQHELIVSDGELISIDQGLKATVDLSSIYRLILKKKRNCIYSIVIERVKGYKEKLPQYEDLDGLAKSLQDYIVPERVKIQHWFWGW